LKYESRKLNRFCVVESVIIDHPYYPGEKLRDEYIEVKCEYENTTILVYGFRRHNYTDPGETRITSDDEALCDVFIRIIRNREHTKYVWIASHKPCEAFSKLVKLIEQLRG